MKTMIVNRFSARTRKKHKRVNKITLLTMQNVMALREQLKT